MAIGTKSANLGRQGKGVDVTPEFIAILQALKKKLNAAKFLEKTGVTAPTLSTWKKKMRAMSGAVAGICQGLHCWPERLGLPKATCDIVRDRLVSDGWQPSACDSILDNLCIQPAPVERVANGLELPQLVTEWIGRQNLLEALSNSWKNGQQPLAWLMGPAGVGKSSLARRLAEAHRIGKMMPRPEGILWWHFQTDCDADAFLESALRFVEEGELRDFPSQESRVMAVHTRLIDRPYLIVLDGLETTQEPDGAMKSRTLEMFLRLFADSSHAKKSFCIVTSKYQPPQSIPVSDACLRWRVEPLAADEGGQLLKKLGVLGTDEERRQLAERWGGHPLRLCLLGKSLVHRHGGDIAKAASLQAHADDVLPDGRFLTAAQRAFLQVLSCFREGVTPDAFDAVFRNGQDQQVTGPLCDLSQSEFDACVVELQMVGLLEGMAAIKAPEGAAGQKSLGEISVQRADGPVVLDDRGRFTLKPLVAEYFTKDLAERRDAADIRGLHSIIHRYYLDKKAKPLPENPELEDLQPYISAVFHLCKSATGSRQFDEAWAIVWEKICLKERFVITVELQAYETALTGIRWFFPNEDIEKEPLMREPPWAKAMLLRGLAVSLRNAGYLERCVAFFERTLGAFKEIGYLREATVIAMHLVEVFVQLGRASGPGTIAMAEQAIDLARAANDDAAVRGAMGHLAWVLHHCGDQEGAARNFREFATLLEMPDEQRPWLSSVAGVFFARYLVATNRPRDARKAAERVLRICEKHRIPDDARHVSEILKNNR